MLSEHVLTEQYFKYWGKTNKQLEQLTAGYHLLPYHCLDVAAVGQSILRANKKLTSDLADFLELTHLQFSNFFCFMLTLHDLGKYASSFQKLYSAGADNLYSPVGYENYDGKYFRHDRLGLYFWKVIQDDVLSALIQNKNVEKRDRERMLDTLMVFADCVLGHHGQPINKQALRKHSRVPRTHGAKPIHAGA